MAGAAVDAIWHHRLEPHSAGKPLLVWPTEGPHATRPRGDASSITASGGFTLKGVRSGAFEGGDRRPDGPGQTRTQGPSRLSPQVVADVTARGSAGTSYREIATGVVHPVFDASATQATTPPAADDEQDDRPGQRCHRGG